MSILRKARQVIRHITGWVRKPSSLKHQVRPEPRSRPCELVVRYCPRCLEEYQACITLDHGCRRVVHTYRPESFIESETCHDGEDIRLLFKWRKKKLYRLKRRKYLETKRARERGTGET